MANRGDKALHGYVAAAISVCAGVALLAVLQSAGLFDSTSFIALLIIPLISYAVFSGAVSEISAPGGWGAKFRSAARRSVEIDNEIEAVNLIEKSSMDRLQRQLDTMPPRGAVAIQFTAGSGPNVPYYDTGMIQTYLNMLERIDPKMVIVIVDEDKKFRASTDALSLKRLQDMDHTMYQFLQFLADEDFTGIRTLLPLTSRSLRRGESNGDGLRIMLEDKVETLVITDEFSRPVGVVRRDKIVARLMSELAEEPS